jgi:hypothetical protein
LLDPLVRFKEGGRDLESFRQELLDQGSRSLFFFITAICGAIAPDPDTGESQLCDFHVQLCAFLEGREPHHPYSTAVVCCSRGTGKSLFVRFYGLWRSLFIDSFSVLLLSNSAKNALENHYLPLYRLFTESDRAPFMRWLFSHRCPDDMLGSNTEKLVFKNRDSNAGAAFSHGGIDARLEGKHPDLVILDDIEGADAESSLAMNEAAYDCYQKIIPLPRHPTRSQIILTLTPWGKNPLAWRLRDQVGWQSEADNATSAIKFFWKPCEDENGNSVWPQRMPKWFLDSIRTQKVFPQQYQLLRAANTSDLFDGAALDKYCYTFLDPNQEQLLYKGSKFDLDKVDDSGYIHPQEQDCVASIKRMRFFLHLDPLHKTAEFRKSPANKQRPAKAAIVVVGVAPDAHAFVMETWTADATLEQQGDALFRLYCKWAPYKVTYESIGAQFWIKSYFEAAEKGNPNYANPVCSSRLAPGIRLPRLSDRLEEASKTTGSKEWEYREGLTARVNKGVLHIRRDQEELRHQLLNATDENCAVDLVDALAQGPNIWQPAISDSLERDFASRRAYVKTFVERGKAMTKTGFKPPAGWR